MADVAANEAAKQAPVGDDRGFTLVELAIVVIVIGVLLAVAIPTFLGARDRAGDVAAKSALTRGIKTNRVLHTDDPLPLVVTPDDLHDAEPSLDVQPYTGPDDVARVLGRVYMKSDSGVVTMVARSHDTCYWTRDDGTTTTYAVNDCTDEPSTFTSEHW